MSDPSYATFIYFTCVRNVRTYHSRTDKLSPECTPLHPSSESLHPGYLLPPSSGFSPFPAASA